MPADTLTGAQNGAAVASAIAAPKPRPANKPAPQPVEVDPWLEMESLVLQADTFLPKAAVTDAFHRIEVGLALRTMKPDVAKRRRSAVAGSTFQAFRRAEGRPVRSFKSALENIRKAVALVARAAAEDAKQAHKV